MSIRIVEETASELDAYATVPIVFTVNTILRVVASGRKTGTPKLVEERVARPRTKDYDKDPGEGPRSWSEHWDISNWGFIGAYVEDVRVGSAAIAWRTPGLEMLQGREDLIALWDIRVTQDFRGQGIGARLFARVVDWGRRRNCTLLRVETQNTNVPACRFYESQGCALWKAAADVYPNYPDEVQLVWQKQL